MRSARRSSTSYGRSTILDGMFTQLESMWYRCSPASPTHTRRTRGMPTSRLPAVSRPSPGSRGCGHHGTRTGDAPRQLLSGQRTPEQDGQLHRETMSGAGLVSHHPPRHCWSASDGMLAAHIFCSLIPPFPCLCLKIGLTTNTAPGTSRASSPSRMPLPSASPISSWPETSSP